MPPRERAAYPIAVGQAIIAERDITEDRCSDGPEMSMAAPYKSLESSGQVSSIALNGVC